MNELQTKTCTKCQQPKQLSQFHKDSGGKLGCRSQCKECHCSQKKQYWNANKEVCLARHKKWEINNKTYIKSYRKLHAIHANALRRKRYNENPETKTRILALVRDYRNNPLNKPIIYATQRRLNKQYSQDPIWRAKMNLRRRLSFVLAGKRKAAHSIELIGCDKEQLKLYLEAKFQPGMTWENYGRKGWHIDHIKPCAAFDLSKPEAQKECFHFTNLQPLWAKDNLQKSDKF